MTLRMVGRVVDTGELPGGAVLLMKRAREAGGWFTWATAGVTVKPVKVASVAETGGAALYEERDFARVHVKGRHPDGRRFVVQYVADTGGAWSADRAYVWETGHFRHVSVTEVRGYIGSVT